MKKIELKEVCESEIELLYDMQVKSFMLLYEKCGFVRIGEEKIVNEKMTLIDYEKR